MLNLDTLLLPTTFSGAAEQALEQALYIARRHGGTLHLLHVVEPAPSLLDAVEDDEAAVLERLEKEAMRHLHALVDSHDTDGVDVVLDVVVGDEPAQRVITYAEEHDADLIVASAKKEGRLKRVIVGSTAEHIIREAPCPVFVVHEPAVNHERPRATGMRRLLKPVDFSDACREAIPLAKQMAALYEAELQVVHVVDDAPPPAAYELDTTPVRVKTKDVEEQVIEHMRRMIDESAGPDVPTDYYVRTGHAADTIVDFADEHATDLIVLAPHGQTGLKDYLLGSTTERVARAAPCPVLVVHPERDVDGVDETDASD